MIGRHGPQTRPMTRRLRVRPDARRAVGFLVGRLRRVTPACRARDRPLGGPHGNLAWIRDELARRDPPIPFVEVTPGTQSQQARLLRLHVPGRVPPRDGAASCRRRLLLPDVRDHAPARARLRIQVWHACGAFKKFGYSVVEQDVRRGLATCRAGPHPLQLRPVPRLLERSRRTTRRRSRSRSRFHGAPRHPPHDLFFRCRALRAAAEARVRARYAIPIEAERVVLYAPTFRGDSVSTRPLTRTSGPRRAAHAPWATDRSSCSGSTRSSVGARDRRRPRRAS